MDRDENYGQLCLYVTLVMCICALQVLPTMHMRFNYWTFDLLSKYFLFRLREKEAEVGLEGLWGVQREEVRIRG